MDSAEPAPRGGHDRLAIRLAKQIAEREWPGRSLAPEELSALVAAVYAGVTSRYALECVANGRPAPESWMRSVPSTISVVLAALLERTPPPVRRPPDFREVDEVAADAGLVPDPRTGAWVRRRL
jgi:hypothetical protein